MDKEKCSHPRVRSLLREENIIDKKDARVLWNIHPKGHEYEGMLKEICLGYFPADKVEDWPTELHDRFSYDYGNGNAEWKDVNFIDVWLKLNSYGFPPNENLQRIMMGFSKVREFREDIAEALCMCYPLEKINWCKKKQD